MKYNIQGISFIIPVFNEELGVSKTINSLDIILKELKISYEIIVVNDGSTDKTTEIIQQFNNIISISHPINIGYGNAIKSGFLKSKFKYIGIIDADNSYQVNMLPEFVKSLEEGYDMVIGSRQNLSEYDSWLKRLCRKFYIIIVKFVITDCNVEDPNSGLRIFKKEMINEFYNLLCGTFSFTTSLTILSLAKPYFIKFLPINLNKRMGKCKVSHFRDSIRTLQIILQGLIYINPIKYFFIYSFLIFIVMIIPSIFLIRFNKYIWMYLYINLIFVCSIIFSFGTLSEIIKILLIKKEQK